MLKKLKLKLNKNIETVLSGINALAEEGAELIILPEMFSCSFDYENLKTHCEKTQFIPVQSA